MHRLRGEQEKYDAMEVSVLVFLFFYVFFWIFEIDRDHWACRKVLPGRLLSYLVIGCMEERSERKAKRRKRRKRRNTLGKAVRLGWVT